MNTTVTTFRDLHRNTTPLCLPNAWDAASARLFASLGAPAIATTSAGVAWTLGYPDGRRLPVEEVVGAVARMVRVLKVPLSFDIENGYADEPTIVATTVKRLAQLGIAGINIEDGSDAPEVLAQKIRAIREALTLTGSDLFINARSDVFLAGLVPESRLVDESIRRAQLYAQAGADGFFLPGVKTGEHIRAVAKAIPVPLNVMSWPDLADAAQLGTWGVRRLSAGSAIAQCVWSTAGELARDFLSTGRSQTLSEKALPYPQLQSLFANQ